LPAHAWLSPFDALTAGPHLTHFYQTSVDAGHKIARVGTAIFSAKEDFSFLNLRPDKLRQGSA
jgi:uncharacterized pyridoxal phosphate-containing UPF0001 family protein